MWLGPRHHAAPAVRPSQGDNCPERRCPDTPRNLFYIRLSFHIRERLASAHGLLPGLFFLMVVLLMTEGGLLFLLSAQGLAVGAVGRGSAVLHGISTLTTLQTAAKPDQMVRKATMPTSVPSRSSQASTDSAVSKPGGKIDISFFLPARFSSVHICPPRQCLQLLLGGVQFLPAGNLPQKGCVGRRVPLQLVQPDGATPATPPCWDSPAVS